MPMRGLLLSAFFVFSTLTLSAQKIAGPLVIEPGMQEGYMLYNPTNYNKAYLVDGCGRVVNTWTSQYAAAHTIYLKPNGTLVRTNLLTNTVIDGGGGSGGGVEILDWDSNVLWSYAYNTDLVRQHHDAQVLPNGNVLLLAWEKKTTTEAIAQGRNPAKLPDNQVWPEHIIEIHPIVPNGGEIVWEWHAWDHLIQDFDNTKANYGVVGDHPELIDLNFTTDGQKDWIHGNGMDYNSQLDQIILSAHSFNEIWIIDHSTTTAQAASHSGGKQGKGGDLLYRWGNPMAYRQGTASDTKLLGQHNPHWIAPGLNNAGKIIVFNNGPLRNYSTVEIIDQPVTASGSYTLTNGKFGPDNSTIAYIGDPPTSFASKNMSSAQVMPKWQPVYLFCRAGLWHRSEPVKPDYLEIQKPGDLRRDRWPHRSNHQRQLCCAADLPNVQISIELPGIQRSDSCTPGTGGRRALRQLRPRHRPGRQTAVDDFLSEPGR